MSSYVDVCLCTGVRVCVSVQYMHGCVYRCVCVYMSVCTTDEHQELYCPDAAGATASSVLLSNKYSFIYLRYSSGTFATPLSLHLSLPPSFTLPFLVPVETLMVSWAQSFRENKNNKRKSHLCNPLSLTHSQCVCVCSQEVFDLSSPAQAVWTSAAT